MTKPEKALIGIGIVYRKLEQWQKSLDSFQQALLIRHQTGDKAGEAASLTNIAKVYTDLSQWPKALEVYQQALPLYQQLGDKRNEAITSSVLGTLCADLSQWPKALEYYQQAVLLYQQLGVKKGEAGALSNLGNVYANLGQPQKALPYFQQVLPLYQQLGLKREEAIALAFIGDVYKRADQPQKALEYYHQSLPILQMIDDKRDEAAILDAMGTSYDSLGQSQKALDYLQQALSINQKIGDQQNEATTLINLGIVYKGLGQFQKALECLQKMLPFLRESGNKNSESGALSFIGEIYHDLKRFDESETAYRQALTCFEQMRDTLNLDAQARADYLEQNLDRYRGLMETLLDQATPTKTQEAFTLSQKMKGRSLSELLAGRATLNTNLSDAERTKLQELRAMCDRLNARIVAEGVTNEIGSKKRAEALRGELEVAERDLSVFTDQLYTRYPEAAASRAAQSASAKQVAAALPKGVALVEFTGVGNKGRLAAFVTTHKGKVGFFDAGMPPAELIKAIAALRAGVVDPRVGDRNAWKAPARALYNALFAPLEKEGGLRGVSCLVICPSGPLWDVPFTTLLDAKNRPLLSRFTLTQAQSATIYIASQDRARQWKPASGRPGRDTATAILAVADPAFAEYKSGFGNDPTLPGQRPLPAPDRPLPAPDRPLPAPDRPLPSPDRPLPAADRALLLPESLRGGRLSALPGTRREAASIQSAFPQASIFVGSRAQESTVKQLAPQTRFLHLATHGFVNDTAPLLSALVLAEPPQAGPGSDEDGFLTARELLDLDLSHVEMTVLSACNTARGVNQSGEGVVGLTWALFAAGCPTQVLSQWAVNDASTATLMEQFYANLKAGKPKAEALRQAALSVSRNPATAHPYYWAPFVLFGSGE